MTQAVEWVAYVGAPLHDEDGNDVGTIEEFYVETGDHGCSVKRWSQLAKGSGRLLEPTGSPAGPSTRWLLSPRCRESVGQSEFPRWRSPARRREAGGPVGQMCRFGPCRTTTAGAPWWCRRRCGSPRPAGRLLPGPCRTPIQERWPTMIRPSEHAASGPEPGPTSQRHIVVDRLPRRSPRCWRPGRTGRSCGPSGASTRTSGPRTSGCSDCSAGPRPNCRVPRTGTSFIPTTSTPSWRPSTG